MHWYQGVLLAGAVIATVLAWNVPRAVLWIALGALSFITSSWWHDAGLPYGAAFGGATNFAICLALYAWAQQRWELRVWNCYHLMLLIDILYLMGFIRSHYDFAVALEIANWLALLVIGAAGIAERAGHGMAFRPLGHSGAGFFSRALFAPRKAPPFWEADG